MDEEAGQVAIVGMAVLLPGADSLEAYWENLASGYDAITDAPPGRWEPEFYDPQSKEPDRVYCRRGAFLDTVEFDPLQFGVVPSVIKDTESEQLIALRVAAAALADAGGTERLPDPERVGVIVGRLGSGSLAQGRFFGRVRLGGLIRDVVKQVLPDVDEDRLDLLSRRIGESFGPFQRESVIGLTPNLTASRVANRLGLGGQAYTVDAACASSLIAVGNALAELASHRLDAVLAGGVHHMHDISFWSMFSQLGALSRRGEIRPFDKAADGLLIGEATGMVLLKRLPDALRQGDRIYAVIRGVGTSSDGRSASLFNPDTSGQALAIRRAWASAGLDPSAPDALGMLEAHGTATPTGDAAELATVAEVFGPGHGGTGPVIGSVKSMVGHTMAAAGIVGLIKSALAVSKGVLPPTLHCDDPHPLLEGTRFAPIGSARPWTGPGPRRAAVNAFGFGGINAHVILEEPPGALPSGRGSAGSHPSGRLVREADQVILLAAASPEAMSRLLDAGDEVLRDRSRQSSPDVASGSGPGCRLGIVDPTAQRIATARDLVARGQAWRGGASIWFSPQPLLTEGAGQVAFVFPGLEAEFSPHLEGVTERLGLVADDTAALGLPGSGAGVEVLRAELLMYDALRRLGITPDALAGYSLGEWAAWAAADIAERRLLYWLAAMECATTKVSVVVVASGCPDIETRLSGYPGVALSIDSAPNQAVLCGPADEISRLVTDLRREGILSQPLPFGAGYHTEYYRDAAQVLAETANLEPRRGQLPVWSATLADLLPDDPARRRDLFFRQLVEPVRFRDTIRAMHQAGIRAFIQVGPGQLASVMHENLRGLEHLTVAANVGQRSGLSQLQRLATALWVEGLAPDLRALDIADPAAARPAARPGRSHPVRLELAWKGISLGGDAGGLLGPAASIGTGASRMEASLSQLRTASSPEARELAAVLEDAAASAVSVLSAYGAQVPPASTAPAPAGPASARPAPDGGHAPPQRIRQRVSLDSMPYLRDHCLFAQPENWPHARDRWPVVPAMAISQHLIDAVESAGAGPKVVKVTGARFNRWVLAEPAQDVEIAVEPAGAGTFKVQYGPFAGALVHTAAAYEEPRPTWHRDRATEQTPDVTLKWLYENISFHGDGYQGISCVPSYGSRHISAEVRVPASPGALLDSGLQLIGFWLHWSQAYRKVPLPVAFDSISFAGQNPPVGSVLTVMARIDSIDNDEIRCGVQYSRGDHVWAQLEGCVLKRFETEAVLARPARHFFAERQPGGWVMAADGWADAATPALIAGQTLGTSGYGQYERQPLRDRRQWLLRQLAVKDAVRLRLRRDGVEDVFPIEIGVTDGQGGQPRVHGWERRPLPGYRVSVASAGKLAVAMARAVSADDRDDGPGVGIVIMSRDLATNGARHGELGADERVILESASRDSGEQENIWITRFMASKEAAAKAAGMTSGAAACTITSADAGHVGVNAADHHYQVGYRELGDPGDILPGKSVVAWTWGPGRVPDYEGSEEHHELVGHEL